MAAQGLLAKLGLRLGTIGSAASLAMALGNGGADTDVTVHTASNRTGWYGDLTAGAEKLSHVIGGVQGPTFQVNSGAMQTILPGTAQVQTTRGNLIMTDAYHGSFGDAGAGYLMDGGGTLLSGSFTEETGQILSYGINIIQISRTDTARVGGIFRLDTRTSGAFGDSHCFVIKSQSGIETESNRFIVDLLNGNTSLNTTGGSTMIGATTLLGSEKLRVTGSVQFDGVLAVGIPSSATGQIQFYQSTVANAVTLQAGATSAPYTLVLPTTQAPGANYLLSNDGLGALSWVAAGAGTIGGSVAATQIAYGSGANTITGSGTLTYSTASGLRMVLGAITDVTPLLITASYNNYIQENLQNLSNGTGASGDYVVTADTGTETTNYIDLGINSSGYTAGIMGAALEGYLYTSDQNLNIGAVAAGKSIIFVAGGTSATANQVASMSSTALIHTGTAGIKTITAATQDAMIMVGRAGGTNSYTGTLIPGTLTASRIWTFPDVAGTVATGTGSANRLAYWSGTNALTSSANLTWTTTSGATLLVDTGGTSTATSAVTYGFTQTITYTGTSTTDKGSAIFTTTATPGAAVSSTYNGISANVTSTLANVQYESGATLNAIVANSSFTSAYTTNATVLGTMNGLLITPAISNTGATASITHTYTSIAGLRVVPGTFNITTATCGITITNYYGAYLGTVTFSGSGSANGVITNRWGLYQADSAATAYVAGKILVGGLTSPGTELLRFNNSGGTGLSAFDSAAHLGIGLTAPTALLHLAAGVATANGAPLKFNAGTNLTNPEAGAVEFDGTYLYYTNSTPTRQTIATRNFLALTDAAPIVVGAITAHQTTASVTLTASGHTISNPTSSIVDGAMLFFRIIQGGTGSYTVTWGTNYQFSSTMPAPTLSTAVGSIDYVGFIYCASSGKWHCISYALSYT